MPLTTDQLTFVTAELSILAALLDTNLSDQQRIDLQAVTVRRLRVTVNYLHQWHNLEPEYPDLLPPDPPL